MKDLLERFKSEKINKFEIKRDFNNFLTKIKTHPEYISNFTINGKELAETSEKRRNFQLKLGNYLSSSE